MRPAWPQVGLLEKRPQLQSKLAQLNSMIQVGTWVNRVMQVRAWGNSGYGWGHGCSPSWTGLLPTRDPVPSHPLPARSVCTPLHRPKQPQVTSPFHDRRLGSKTRSPALRTSLVVHGRTLCPLTFLAPRFPHPDSLFRLSSCLHTRAPPAGWAAGCVAYLGGGRAGAAAAPGGCWWWSPRG